MEKPERSSIEDRFLVSLRETGECRIPLRGEDQEGVAFVDLCDQARDYANQMAVQLGVDITTIGSWTKELDHHLIVQVLR